MSFTSLNIEHFSFAWPAILLLLPAAFLIHYFVPPAKKQKMCGLRVPFYLTLINIDQQIKKNPSIFSRKLVAYLVWILLVIAAARPIAYEEVISLPRLGRNILLAVDISGSMQTPDMLSGAQLIQRISSVKQVAAEFINHREGDRIGLILFGSYPYIQAPLTFDHQTVADLLKDATLGLAGPRTALGDAIGLAIKQLRKTDGDRILILLTDGANNAGRIDPLNSAMLAANENIRIYTIGVGGESNTENFLANAIMPNAELDEETLKQIAELTKGQFFRARDMQTLTEIYNQIDQIEPRAIEQGGYRPQTEYYYWPLLLAFLLMIILSSKHIRFPKHAAINK